MKKKKNVDDFYFKKDEWKYEKNDLKECSTYFNINKIKTYWNNPNDHMYEHIFDAQYSEKKKVKTKRKNNHENKDSQELHSDNYKNDGKKIIVRKNRVRDINWMHRENGMEEHLKFLNITPEPHTQKPSFQISGIKNCQSNHDINVSTRLSKRQKIQISNAHHVNKTSNISNNSMDKTPKKLFTIRNINNDVQGEISVKKNNRNSNQNKNKNSHITSNSSLNKYDFIRFVCSPNKKQDNDKNEKYETRVRTSSTEVIPPLGSYQFRDEKKVLQKEHNDVPTPRVSNRNRHHEARFVECGKGKSEELEEAAETGETAKTGEAAETVEGDEVSRDVTAGGELNSTPRKVPVNATANAAGWIDLDSTESIDRLSRNFFINSKKFFINDFQRGKAENKGTEDQSGEDQSGKDHLGEDQPRDDLPHSRGVKDARRTPFRCEDLKWDESNEWLNQRNVNNKSVCFNGKNSRDENCDENCHSPCINIFSQHGDKVEERQEQNTEECYEQFSQDAYSESDRFSPFHNNMREKTCKMTKSLYSYLDVPYNCTAEEIKKSYKDKIKVHHPDKGGNIKHFLEIKLSYDILINEKKRKMYDKYGHSIVELLMSEKFQDYNISSDEKNEEDIKDEETLKIYDIFVQKYHNVSYIHNQTDLKISSNQYNAFQKLIYHFFNQENYMFNNIFYIYPVYSPHVLPFSKNQGRKKKKKTEKSPIRYKQRNENNTEEDKSMSIDSISEQSSSTSHMGKEITIWDAIKRKNLINLFNELDLQFMYFYKNCVFRKMEPSEEGEDSTNRFQYNNSRLENTNVYTKKDNVAFLKGNSFTILSPQEKDFTSPFAPYDREGDNMNNPPEGKLPHFFEDIQVSPFSCKTINEHSTEHVNDFYKWFEFFFEYQRREDNSERWEEKWQMSRHHSGYTHKHKYMHDTHQTGETQTNRNYRLADGVNGKESDNISQKRLGSKNGENTPFKGIDNLVGEKGTPFFLQKNSEQFKTFHQKGDLLAQFEQKEHNDYFFNINMDGKIKIPNWDDNKNPYPDYCMGQMKDDELLPDIEEKYGFNLLKRSEHKVRDLTYDFNYIYVGNSTNKKKQFLLFIREDSIKKFFKIKLYLHKIKRRSNLKHISLFEKEIDKVIKNMEYILLLITYKDELIPLNDYYLLDKNLYGKDHYCIPLYIKKNNIIVRPTYFHFKWIVYTLQSFILFNFYFEKVKKYMCSFPFFNHKYGYFKNAKEVQSSQDKEDRVTDRYIFFHQYIIKNKEKYLKHFPHNLILHLKNISAAYEHDRKSVQVNLSPVFVLTPNKPFALV
ncbi:DnaJ protein, putative [Plasmodium ovale wallikeri]|uniref:DnaJ protein, putative n=2 Tax=Plasmodium ovale TaxID=36330 RepID=A0A1C3KR40_PLAOA|nr:DnaJ protein, putative [Plasmodium ovale wallikeri]SBT76585.1 DnaJ protein, putative [Plasmodium ovale]